MAAIQASWLRASPVWVRVLTAVAILLGLFVLFDVKQTVRHDQVTGTVTGILEVRPEDNLLSDLFVFDQGPRYIPPPELAAVVRVTGPSHLGSIVVATGLPVEDVNVGSEVDVWIRGEGQAAYGGPGFANFNRAWIALALVAIAWFAAAKGTERWRLAERNGQ